MSRSAATRVVGFLTHCTEHASGGSYTKVEHGQADIHRDHAVAGNVQADCGKFLRDNGTRKRREFSKQGVWDGWRWGWGGNLHTSFPRFRTPVKTPRLPSQLTIYYAGEPMFAGSRALLWVTSTARESNTRTCRGHPPRLNAHWARASTFPSPRAVRVPKSEATNGATFHRSTCEHQAKIPTPLRLGFVAPLSRGFRCFALPSPAWTPSPASARPRRVPPEPAAGGSSPAAAPPRSDDGDPISTRRR